MAARTVVLSSTMRIVFWVLATADYPAFATVNAEGRQWAGL
jgi:hypothetical protein